jgi:hypothetical protein
MTVLVTGSGSVQVPDTAFNDWVGFAWVCLLFVAVFLMMLYGNRKEARSYPSKNVEGY